MYYMSHFPILRFGFLETLRAFLVGGGVRLVSPMLILMLSTYHVVASLDHMQCMYVTLQHGHFGRRSANTLPNVIPAGAAITNAHLNFGYREKQQVAQTLTVEQVPIPLSYPIRPSWSQSFDREGGI